jgi:hypothetical protein
MEGGMMAPAIQIIQLKDQRDRLDVAYYDPRFLLAEQQLADSQYPLVPFVEVMTDDARYGILPPSSEYGDEGILLIRSTDLSPHGIDYEQAVHVPEAYLNSRARIRQGDVLIGVKGACAFFDIYAVTEIPPPAIVNGSIFRFQCKGQWNPRFVALWLLSDPVQTSVFRERANIGISYISLDVLTSLRIPRLADTEQALILDRFEAICGAAKEFGVHLHALELQWQEVLRNIDQVFEKHLGIKPPPKCENKTRILRREDQQDRLDWGFYDPSRIATEERLAEDFESRLRLREVGGIHRSAISPSTYPDKDFNLVRVKWHAKGAQRRETRKGEDIAGALTEVHHRDVVISRIDSTQRAVAVIPEDLDGAFISNEFYALRVDPQKYLPELLCRILATSRYVAFFFTQKTGSTKRLRLQEEVIENLRLPAVGLDKQRAVIADLAESDKRLHDLLSEESAIVERQRQIVAAAKKDVLRLLSDADFTTILRMAAWSPKGCGVKEDSQ